MLENRGQLSKLNAIRNYLQNSLNKMTVNKEGLNKVKFVGYCVTEHGSVPHMACAMTCD